MRQLRDFHRFARANDKCFDGVGDVQTGAVNCLVDVGVQPGRDFAEQILFAAEMVKQSTIGNTCGAANCTGGNCCKAVLRKQFFSDIDDRLPRFRGDLGATPGQLQLPSS